MIKRNIKKVVLGMALLATPLMADYGYKAQSLVGIEGGFSQLDYENGTSDANEQYDTNLANLGIKIGAETEDFRAFISGRYFFDSSKQYDYLTTFGLELQYKFNVTEVFNVYLGANGGVANAKFRAENEDFSRTFSDPYIGGDLGANIHLGSSTDLEIGARVMSIQATNTKNDVSYRIGNIVNAYASLIFKWQMN